MKNYESLDSLVKDLRKEYRFGKIEDGSLAKDPLRQFTLWFEEALKAKIQVLNVLMLATASKKAKPSVRAVLLKGFGPKGFVFFSNYESRKGKDMKENPAAEALLYWPEIERQVRIAGRLKKTSREESYAYFSKRPRSAQIGAWISDQSKPVSGRAELERRGKAFEKKFEGKEIPLPENWGGFVLVPESYEFWQGRENRLNDRFFYRKSKSGWKLERLQP